MPTLTDAAPLPLSENSGSSKDFPFKNLKAPDPNEPVWGLGGALFIWIASLALVVTMPLVFVIPYAAHRGLNTGMPDYLKALAEFAINDKTAVLLQVLALVPSHLITLVLVWAMVTRFGKQSFWAAISWGWEWARGRRLAYCIVLGVLLFVVGSIIAKVLGADQHTQLEQIINSSFAARYTISLLAVCTAPLVEELVYRGVLYAALRRAVAIYGSFLLALGLGVKLDPASQEKLGVSGAVLLVLALFTVIHVPQYWPNLGVIAAVALLSIVLTLVRAYSGRLFPCIVIHLVFNGIQAILLILEPYAQRFLPTPEPTAPTALIFSLLHLRF